MDLYLFHLELEEGCQRVQDLNKDISERVYIFEGLLHHTGENILVRVVMILIVVEEHMEIGDPLKEEDIKVRMEGHHIEEAIRIEDTLGEGIQIGVEDPLMDMEDPLRMEDPLIMEDPLMMEDPLIMEDP